MVALQILHCNNIAKLELHLPEFPSLNGSTSVQVTREILNKTWNLEGQYEAQGTMLWRSAWGSRHYGSWLTWSLSIPPSPDLSPPAATPWAGMASWWTAPVSPACQPQHWVCRWSKTDVCVSSSSLVPVCLCSQPHPAFLSNCWLG